MNNIFQPPISQYKNKLDQEKFNLTWYIGVTLLIFTTLLTVLYINYDIDNLIFSVGSIILALTSLLILFFTGKYWFVGILVVVVGSVLFQFSIYTLSNPDRIIDTLWIIIFSLYGLYMLNKYWCMAILTINLFALMLHQIILGPQHVFYKPISELKLDGQIDYYVNLTVAIFFIVFLILKIAKRLENKSSEKS